MKPSEHWKALQAKWAWRGARWVLLGVALIGLAIYLLCAKGCGSSVKVEPGTAEVHNVQTRTIAPDGTVTITTDVGGASKGVGGAATGEKSADFKADGAPAPLTLPSADSPGGIQPSTATGGGSSLGGSAFSNPLIWVGLLCILAAGGCVYMGWRGAAVVAGGTGAVLLAIGFYPVLLIYGVIAVVVGGGGYLLYMAHTGKRSSEALRAVVAGVEQAPAEVAAVVKAKIAEQADQADKSTIAAVKVKDNL